MCDPQGLCRRAALRRGVPVLSQRLHMYVGFSRSNGRHRGTRTVPAAHTWGSGFPAGGGRPRAALEPFLDISLDLLQDAQDAGVASADTLQACLRRFTLAERLRASCERCRQEGDATKQFTVRTLPPVLAIHLKRFEHRTAGTVKVDGHIAFPMSLDMTPFLSGHAASTQTTSYDRAGSRIFAVLAPLTRSRSRYGRGQANGTGCWSLAGQSRWHTDTRCLPSSIMWARWRAGTTSPTCATTATYVEQTEHAACACDGVIRTHELGNGCATLGGGGRGSSGLKTTTTGSSVRVLKKLPAQTRTGSSCRGQPLAVAMEKVFDRSQYHVSVVFFSHGRCRYMLYYVKDFLDYADAATSGASAAQSAMPTAGQGRA